jgi:alkanesulfonate monooxygenase SsuD/methylene tetrahydromethanopterin reductase-like flavin-dependent oxidoreductase (luciferase family)
MEFGVNLNNREPLITSDYTLADLLDLAEFAENRGFGSVWVGDSLFSKPRYEPVSLLSAISQRTTRAKLGTACLVTSTRNPLYLALEWATLDQLSGGRTVLGACMGNPEHGVRREFEALGLPFGQRAAVFEEGLAVLRSLWTTGKITHHGRYYDFDDVAFYSGPRGRKAAADLGQDFSRYTVSYQVTMNIGDSAEQAQAAFGEYIGSYYPELSKSVDLSDWGPAGTPEVVADWFRRFSAAGVDHFICRFGALDQFAQVERFAADVIPALAEKGPGQ